ncbi:uncharacterized membrane protein YgaE (UPF0421/DUF939 family) [Microbacterium sp. SORGH_AS 862]|nr:uncharacterized membrane protein YgaE (UPF0421/DUF939 family) [Microbacterium sp. SORGH_AS_0862]
MPAYGRGMSRPALAVRRRLSELVEPPRLLLAAKVAGAAAIAWTLAPFVPFTDSEYSYYAPLGVLISMYSTLAGSMRAGLETLAGLAVGIAWGFVGIALLVAGAPSLVAVALVTGAGTICAGLTLLGTGRDWIPIAALFVLLVGNADAQSYSSSYLITTAFGVLVGLVVNVLVVPPLYIRRATARLNALRDEIGEVLHDAAHALGERTVDTERLRHRIAELTATADAVAGEVAEAVRSQRGNPRARHARADVETGRRRLEALRAVAAATGQLAEALTRLTLDAELGRAQRRALADAVAACAEHTATPIDDSAFAARLSAADAALAAYRRRIRHASGSSALDRWEAAVSLRRIIDASRPFARAD